MCVCCRAFNGRAHVHVVNASHDSADGIQTAPTHITSAPRKCKQHKNDEVSFVFLDILKVLQC